MRIYTIMCAFLNNWSRELAANRESFSKHLEHLDNCNAKYLLRRQRDGCFSLRKYKRIFVSRKITLKKNLSTVQEIKFVSSGTFSCLFILQEWTRFKPCCQCDDVARQLIKRKIRELCKMAGASAESPS